MLGPPTRKVLPCLSLSLCVEAVHVCVRFSVFVYVCAIYLLTGLFIYYLLVDEQCSTY